MSDLARWDLCGPARTLRSESAEWNPETGEWCPLKNLFVATFRAEGELSEIEHHNPDGSVPREVCVYDEGGRLTEDQCWSNDLLTRRVVHTYDDALAESAQGPHAATHGGGQGRRDRAKHERGERARSTDLLSENPRAERVDVDGDVR